MNGDQGKKKMFDENRQKNKEEAGKVEEKKNN